MSLVLKQPTVLPGFGLTLGFTLFYLSLIVLIPLAGLFVKTSALTWDQFWLAVTDPRTVASYQLTFGLSLVAALINALFGVALLVGLYFGQLFLKLVMGEAVRMTDEGWRKLTVRWAIFFFAMAILNEFVWRTQSGDFWVNFKVFGLLPISLVFALAQAPLMTRHMIEEQSR